MPSAVIDGIRTRYEITGSGPELLLYSPGGFDSRLENWSTLGRYAQLGLLDAVSEHYTCITFDRRESGLSGGRVERLGWSDYVAQGRGLLDHLSIERAHLMGGCVGCSSVLALALAHPERARSMVLFSPAGGPRYRITQHARFADHASFVRAQGLPAVVALVRSSAKSFTQDPRVGPWVTVIRTDPQFASEYAQQNVDDYLLALSATARVLYDRDTVPGAEPEDLMALPIPALIVPGNDTSHALSAARYLQECLPQATYWDVPVSEQTPQTTPAQILNFLSAHSAESPSSAEPPG